MSIGFRSVNADSFITNGGTDAISLLGDGGVAFTTLPAVGQCRLQYISATQVRLVPFQGNLLTIGLVNRLIPSAGVNLAATGLVANTTYLIYAYMNGTTMTLEASTTTHVVDATTGIEVKSGDSSRTLVGMVRILATAANFVSSTTARLVISWFNRRTLGMRATSGVSANWSSTTPVELNQGYRCNFLTWGDEDVQVGLSGSTSTNTIGSWAGTQCAIDGTAVYGDIATVEPYVGAAMGHSLFSPTTGLAEGFHYVTLLAYIANGGTGTWNPFWVSATVRG